MNDHQHIRFIKPGQPVRLKLATYPYHHHHHGMLEGMAKTVIADSQTQSNTANTDTTNNSSDKTSESGAPSTLWFKAMIELKERSLIINGMQLPFAAGMQLSAETIEGKRTVVQCLLSPVKRVGSEGDGALVG